VRRTHGRAEPFLRASGICLDESPQVVYAAEGSEHVLTGIEFRLLRYLMTHPEQVLSKARLAEHIYDFDDEHDSNVIEVYIKRLRQKIGADVIVTRRGQGYMFKRKDRAV
jgi:two-component system OmpR family response regulator